MSNKPFGVEELNIVGSAGTSLIEAVADLHIRVGGGRTVGIGTSVFNIQDGTADANNDSVLNVGIVTANEYYGLFKGTIDPGTSTISIASSLTDVIRVNDNQIYPTIAAEDSILFWDVTEFKTTYLKIGDGVTIDDDTLKGDYTLPTFGTTNAASGLRLTAGSITDDVNVTGTGGVSVVGNAGNNTLTIDGSGTPNDNTTYTLPTFGTTNAASGLRLTGSDGSTDDVNVTGTGGVSVVGNAGNNTLTVDGSGTPNDNTTYTLPVFGTGNGSSGARLTGSDGSTDDVNVTGTGGITVIGNGSDTLTISASGVVTVPPGVIVMYNSGTAPSGWVLCDNSAAAVAAGAPDLRDKFIVGAGGGYPLNQTGGSKDAVVVGHDHTFTTSTDGAHTHTYTFRSQTERVDNDEGHQRNSGAATYNTGSSGTHAHSGTTTYVGESGIDKNIPPYYALTYIMKT